MNTKYKIGDKVYLVERYEYYQINSFIITEVNISNNKISYKEKCGKSSYWYDESKLFSNPIEAVESGITELLLQLRNFKETFIK